MLLSWPQDDTSHTNDLLTEFRDKGEKFAEPFRSAFLAIRDAKVIWSSNLSQWLPSAWDNHKGRVTLAGDAAHPMTFRSYSSNYPFRLFADSSFKIGVKG